MTVETRRPWLRMVLWLQVVAGFCASATHAVSAPLGEDACRAAKDEIVRLEEAGVKADHERGPEWAQANLDESRLAQVKRWIELQETALFQCPRPKPAPKPTEAAAGGQNGDKAKNPENKTDAKPADTSGAVTGSTEVPADKPQKPKKVTTKKPKPPVEDAYIPPAPSAGPEFQHTAPGNLGDVIPGAGLSP